ncbi:hypothetical protein BKA63DRAFT_580169 [Paraphoma chrysanthemicola]|nr:hypothetical protein BKA63DRAFT_580169 [Paraphoma chrysanthemicola]
MLPSLTTLTTLTTLLLATTTFTTTLAHPSLPHANPNSCPHKNLPTTDSYISGYKHFCATYLPPSPNGLFYFPNASPIVATYDLTKPDSSVIKWIFKAYVWHTIDQVGADMGISKEYCENTFGAFMESETGSCVLSGGLMGERLVKGGVAVGTNLRFETRERK